MGNWLLITVLLPLVGAVVIAAMGSRMPGSAGRDMARWLALAVTVVTTALAGWIVFQDPASQLAFDMPWLDSAELGVSIRFSLALDGLSLWMFGLSALLMVTSVLVSWEAIKDRAPAFYALLLLLESGMLGVFAARDVILFYIFFEFTLIPLFFLIGIWGSEERRYAAIKFFLFTLAGSLLTFLGLLTIVLWVYNHGDGAVTRTLSFAFDDLTRGLAAHPMDTATQVWVFLALFAGFAIKVPLFPLHTWLPLAHVQAPTAGSVILAGVLLKIGTYGFVRFSLPMLPDATALCMPYVLWLSVAGIIYGALVALAQGDMKRLIAYSSVSHMGFIMLGLFSLNRLGVQGGVLQMINHGLSTGGLFALVGMIYERYHTREIKQLGGLAKRTPMLALFFLLFTFSSIGLPGLNGFAGEFLILLGMFQRAWLGASEAWSAQYITIAVLSVFGVVLGAWYMLWLVERVFFGPLKEPAHHDEHEHAGHAGHASIPDMYPREICALVPLLVFAVWIGLWPGFFLDRMSGTLNEVTAQAAAALEQRQSVDQAPPVITTAQAAGQQRRKVFLPGPPAVDSFISVGDAPRVD